MQGWEIEKSNKEHDWQSFSFEILFSLSLLLISVLLIVNKNCQLNFKCTPIYTNEIILSHWMDVKKYRNFCLKMRKKRIIYLQIMFGRCQRFFIRLSLKKKPQTNWWSTFLLSNYTQPTQINASLSTNLDVLFEKTI